MYIPDTLLYVKLPSPPASATSVAFLIAAFDTPTAEPTIMLLCVEPTVTFDLLLSTVIVGVVAVTDIFAMLFSLSYYCCIA